MFVYLGMENKKNADMPAFALSASEKGLTKREYASIQLMKGMLSNTAYDYYEPDEMAKGSWMQIGRSCYGYEKDYYII